jgi:hypothetical protein
MLAEIKNKIVPVSILIDEAFDEKRASAYHLICQIGVDGIKLAVKETQRNKFIALTDYKLQEVYDFDTLIELIDVVAKENKLLQHKYKAVSCLIVNNLSTIIPTPLFEDSKKEMYLKFNTALAGNEYIAVDNIKNLDAKNVFALPQDLKNKLSSLFSNSTYHHFSSVLIESILAQNKNQTTKKLFVHVQPSHFEAILVEGKKLLFYNSFNYQTNEDFIYYLLFVFEQLQLNPEMIEAVLLGEVEKNSEMVTIAQKYIRNVKFGERSESADYSYQLQTLPKHFYFTLFNDHL